MTKCNPTVIMADDSERFLAVLRKLLEPKYNILATAADGECALILSLKLHPDFLILDINMPTLNGIQVAKKVHEAIPSITIIFLTLNESDAYIVATRAISSAYIFKKHMLLDLLPIMATLQGQNQPFGA